MCLAKVYTGGDKREIVAEEVATLRTENGRLLLTTIFGEQKEIAAAIREIDFRSSSVILEKA